MMKDEQSRAGSAHEIVMMNLAIFHLLLPVAALSSGYLSIFLSIALIGTVLMNSWVLHKSHQKDETALVISHWQLAWRRCRLLILSYIVATVIMLLGWLLASLQTDHNMFSIMLLIFSRIAAVPIVLMVLGLFIMETTALSQARQGVFPDKT